MFRLSEYLHTLMGIRPDCVMLESLTIRSREHVVKDIVGIEINVKTNGVQSSSQGCVAGNEL
jgi:hypothetical protein